MGCWQGMLWLLCILEPSMRSLTAGQSTGWPIATARWLLRECVATLLRACRAEIHVQHSRQHKAFVAWLQALHCARTLAQRAATLARATSQSTWRAAFVAWFAQTTERSHLIQQLLAAQALRTKHRRLWQCWRAFVHHAQLCKQRDDDAAAMHHHRSMQRHRRLFAAWHAESALQHATARQLVSCHHKCWQSLMVRRMFTSWHCLVQAACTSKQGAEALSRSDLASSVSVSTAATQTQPAELVHGSVMPDDAATSGHQCEVRSTPTDADAAAELSCVNMASQTSPVASCSVATATVHSALHAAASSTMQLRACVGAWRSQVQQSKALHTRVQRFVAARRLRQLAHAVAAWRAALIDVRLAVRSILRLGQRYQARAFRAWTGHVQLSQAHRQAATRLLYLQKRRKLAAVLAAWVAQAESDPGVDVDDRRSPADGLQQDAASAADGQTWSLALPWSVWRAQVKVCLECMCAPMTMKLVCVLK